MSDATYTGGRRALAFFSWALAAAALSAAGTARGQSWCTYDGQFQGPDCPPLDPGKTVVTICVRCSPEATSCPSRPFFYISGRQCAVGFLVRQGPTCGDCTAGARYAVVLNEDAARCGAGVEDGHDNDGDSMIDEEACDGFDNDADGRMDEDTYHAYIAPADAIGIDGPGRPDAPAVHLRAPWPNPFRDRVAIVIDAPRAAILRLAVFDATGRMVRSLWSGVVTMGRHETVWDGRDAAGHTAPAGSYFIRLSGGMEADEIRRVVLLR